MSVHQTGLKHPRFRDITGQTFGRLTVERAIESRKGQWWWECKCSCGTRMEASTHSLRSKTGGKSCGCTRRTDVNHSFWSRLERNKATGCWEWQGGTTTFGYGAVGFGTKFYTTHRLAYQLCCGDIPDGLFVLHKCDNPKCCHPAHLYAGTPRDNMIDVAKRGRKKTKLTRDQVKEIRAACDAGKESYPKIGKRFGVSGVMVRRIDKRLSWGFVE